MPPTDVLFLMLCIFIGAIIHLVLACRTPPHGCGLVLPVHLQTKFRCPSSTRDGPDALEEIRFMENCMCPAIKSKKVMDLESMLKMIMGTTFRVSLVISNIVTSMPGIALVQDMRWHEAPTTAYTPGWDTTTRQGCVGNVTKESAYQSSQWR